LGAISRQRDGSAKPLSTMSVIDHGVADGRRESTPASPLRITIVEPLGTGGMIHYAYQLSSALSGTGADVTLLTSTDYELTALPHSFRVDERLRLWPHHDRTGAEAHRPSPFGRAARKVGRVTRRLSRGARLLRAWIVLVRQLDPRETDVVQFGTLRFPFESLFLRILTRRGFVLADICHEPELRERPDRLTRRLASVASRATYQSFDVVFLHGSYNRELFCRLYPSVRERTFEIVHGNQAIFRVLGGDVESRTAALRRRYGLDHDERVVLFFGHLVPSKGVEDLVRAHALSSTRTCARLVIAGYASKLFDVDALASLIHELDVDSSVVLDLRYVPGEDVAALMALTTVVVLPYRNATQSGALQVAYTFGRPVIATDVGGIPEAVDDGHSGLLVPPNSPSELARAIEDILSSPARAEQMGSYARRLAETRFSWDRVAADMLAVYERLVEEQASTPKRIRRRVPAVGD
jgi:glycosyltransferase involved in cell wall biosynthesis